MDKKKQMYLRLLFNKSFSSEYIQQNMYSIIKSYLKNNDIVEMSSLYQYAIRPSDPIEKDKQNKYKIIGSAIVIDYIRTNYIGFRKMYDEFAYNDKEFKKCISKDDINCLMDSEYNDFLFNILIYNNCYVLNFS